MRWFAALVVVFALMSARAARADVLVLGDGTRLEGKVVAMDDLTVVIEVALGTTTARMTVARDDLRSLQFGDAPVAPAAGDVQPAAPPAPPPAPPPAAPPAVGAAATAVRPDARGPTAARPGGERVLFALDMSGSMAIGRRWVQACAEVQERARALAPEVRFGLLFFHEVVEQPWTGFIRRNDSSLSRLAHALERQRPDLRAGTDLAHALSEAVERGPTRIVLLTDGVVTRNHEHLLATFHGIAAAAADERAVILDAVAVQDGRYVPTNVEDFSAANGVLQRLSTDGKGAFAALARAEEAPARAFVPTEGALPPPARVQIAGVESNNVIVARVLRPYPKFRVRVHDPLVARSLLVTEYAGISWYEVITRRGEHVLERTGRREFVPEGDGEHLSGELYVQVVGSEDARYRTTGNEWRGGEGRTLGTLGPNSKTARKRDYVTVQAVPGGTIEVHYHRAGETFTEAWVLRETNGDITGN